jgi:Na+-transporting NADH:ubiquinone oxidoreductase subunit A
MLEIRIEADGKMEYEPFGTSDPASMTKELVTEKLIKSGTWTYIRQRPYSIIANPEDNPKAIYISAFDSAPLAPDFDFLVENEEKAFQTGLDAISKLTSGKIHLNVKEGKTVSNTLLQAKGVQVNRFAGPHPTGNVGVQIHHIMLPMLENNLRSANSRYISGNVLTGKKVDKDGYLGFYDNQVTVIPEGNYHEFLGWGMPRFDKFSFSKSFFSWLTPNKKYNLDTNINGGHRAFVLTGEYEKVFPMNIYPMQLLKAIMVKDFDLMENLGIYEVDEEDFALCEFIDVSKTEMQATVREGLDFMLKEMS